MKTKAKQTKTSKTTKTVKKLPEFKPLPFNKAEVLAFANDLYSDVDGRISCLKLCDGALSNGKDGNRTLHCAVGEAYLQFVNNDMKKVLADKAGYISVYDERDEDGDSLGAMCSDATGAVIDALVDVAQLKKPTLANKKKLAQALNNAVSLNDDLGSEEYLERSQSVAEVFRKQVAPLLK